MQLPPDRLVTCRVAETGQLLGQQARRLVRPAQQAHWISSGVLFQQPLECPGETRIHTAYLLKESFGQLWDYTREGWAQRFFENWRNSLKWQRLKPYEKFARMIERHWDGIAAHCRTENKVALGFVEGLNNKIRVIQRRAYGLRDEEYLRLKILTCMLKPI